MDASGIYGVAPLLHGAGGGASTAGGDIHAPLGGYSVRSPHRMAPPIHRVRMLIKWSWCDNYNELQRVPCRRRYSASRISGGTHMKCSRSHVSLQQFVATVFYGTD